jgi:hypothetical protein
MFGSKAIAGYPDARVPVYSLSLKVLYENCPIKENPHVYWAQSEIYCRTEFYNILKLILQEVPVAVVVGHNTE